MTNHYKMFVSLKRGVGLEIPLPLFTILIFEFDMALFPDKHSIKLTEDLE